MLESWNIIPSHFIPVPTWPGYFFDPETDGLYSIKVSGTLRRLKFQPGKQVGVNYFPPRYTVSKNGKSKFISARILAETCKKAPRGLHSTNCQSFGNCLILNIDFASRVLYNVTIGPVKLFTLETTMKSSPLFGLASDLHMDFAEMNPEFFDWRGDVLLLAGDLAEEDHLRKMHDFWDRVADMAPEIYTIAGNHEFYGSEIDVAHDHLREYLSNYPHIHILENDFVYTNGVYLFGSTLWSDFERGSPVSMWDVGRRLNDYQHIRNKRDGYRKINTHEIYYKHQRSLEYLTEFLSDQTDPLPVVVMTHHAPSFQSIRKDYVGDSLNGGYASSLENLILDHPRIKAWVHGHIHTYKDYMIGDCRVMCNARGYPGERSDKYGPYEVKPFRIGESNV